MALYDVYIIIIYIHLVDGIGIRAKMNYDYKVAGAEDLISVLVRGIEEGTCGNHQQPKGAYIMSETLNKKEVDQLMDLFNKIKLDLSDNSFPTRTNRLEAVENMKKVLEIHNYVISEYEPEEEEIKMPFPDARDQHLINKNLNKATGGK